MLLFILPWAECLKDSKNSLCQSTLGLALEKSFGSQTTLSGTEYRHAMDELEEAITLSNMATPKQNRKLHIPVVRIHDAQVSRTITCHSTFWSIRWWEFFFPFGPFHFLSSNQLAIWNLWTSILKKCLFKMTAPRFYVWCNFSGIPDIAIIGFSHTSFMKTSPITKSVKLGSKKLTM